MAKYIYMKVSDDEYELPIAVADTVPKLAKLLGVKSNTIYATMHRHKNGEVKRSSFVRVKLDELI